MLHFLAQLTIRSVKQELTCQRRRGPKSTAKSGEVSPAIRPDGIHALSGLTLDSDVTTTPFGYSPSDLISKPEQLPPKVLIDHHERPEETVY